MEWKQVEWICGWRDDEEEFILIPLKLESFNLFYISLSMNQTLCIKQIAANSLVSEVILNQDTIKQTS